MLLTVYKPKYSRALKSLRDAVNSYKPRTGMLEAFPSVLKQELNYGISNMQFVIYTMVSFTHFLLSLSSHFISMLPYLVLQWPYIFH